MILVLSNEFDQSTCDVIDWLYFYDQNFVRINESDMIRLERITLRDGDVRVCILHNEMKIDLEDVQSYWYRRGEINLPCYMETNESDFSSIFQRNMEREKDTLKDFLHSWIETFPGLGSYFQRSMNKLNVLTKALKCGFRVPETHILSSDYELEASLGSDIITKAISEAIHIVVPQHGFIMNYTTHPNGSFLSRENRRFPSLIQQNIVKKYEVRVFYLKGEVYAMAIFSQGNEKTKNDFRNYDHSRPNRTVPYSLPRELRTSVTLLMNCLQLDTGSIDLLVDHNRQYFFLEVNPVGQYGMTSYPCNYHLDQKIAKILIADFSNMKDTLNQEIHGSR